MELPQSPYKRGADQGFYFGIYLSVMFIASVAGTGMPLLGLAGMLMALGVPFIIFRFLRRTYIEEQYTSNLSALWMQGIVIFACGALIHSVIAIIYLKWIDPTFIINQIDRVIELYDNLDTPSATTVADTLRRIVSAGAVPSATAIVVEMVWLAIFSGSILSLLMSILVRAMGRRRHKTSIDTTINAHHTHK